MTFRKPNWVMTPEEQDKFVLQYFLNLLDNEETK